MSKRYKVCVIDEEAEKQHCMEIETAGLPMEALTALIDNVLNGIRRLFGAKPTPGGH